MLSFEKIALKSADLGKYNDIPDITAPKNPLWFTCDETVSEKERELIGVGMVASALPYRVQNLYNRELLVREYTAAVLENEYIKATFLPEFGGRLWSLYDKKLKRDIIYKNDALIFGNLAIRNAWFAGGVEWNVGIRGHSHFTCSPLFSRKVIGKAGNEILRMYELEEIRGLVYCIEATLKDASLVMNITVKNINDEPTYMYWWSNIAVEQKAGTRFFVPTDRSFVTSYRNGGFCISKIDTPIHKGKDTSDPYHAYDAIDYFFDIPDERKKWISSIEEDGKGLLQYSDKRLFGRKTFLWGSIPGGRHWNSWLTDGRDYYEIQAGLTKTQFEHFTVAGGEELSWREVYQGIDLGTSRGDYFEVADAIDSLVPEEFDLSGLFEEERSEPLSVYGRGKGYLFETLRHARFHEKCEFPRESVGKNEKYYLFALQGKAHKGNEHTEFIAGGEWRALLEKKKKPSAFDLYILSLIVYRQGDYESALDYLTRSVKKEKKFYSVTALALLLSNVFDQHERAYILAKEATRLSPNSLPVAVKYGELCIKAGAYASFVAYYEKAPRTIRENGRIKMYMGRCLVELGECEWSKKFINKDLVVEDFKEGEYSVSGIWTELYRKELSRAEGRPAAEITDQEVLARFPLPYEIDFRMH